MKTSQAKTVNAGDWITGNIVLNIQGSRVEMRMTVPAAPVKPHRMLPVFQKMTNSFVGVSVDAVEAAGKAISCKMGCAACCRQPVPLAEVEIYQIADLVDSMPEPRRGEIKKRFADAFGHFTELSWFERLKDLRETYDRKNPDVLKTAFSEIFLEYFYAAIPCPFLENEACSIYENRPLACREYLVTSPAENCRHPTAESIDRVELLIEPSSSVRDLGRTENSMNLGALTMISALDFAQRHPENFPEKPGPRWAADFFELLTKTRISGRPAALVRKKRRKKASA